MVWGYGVKTLSIKQPWAELILENKKTIEIRSWSTKFRGYFFNPFFKASR
jgi:delta-aminolevulinic acid dehydratase/porphobilinogen synthase